MEAPDTLSSPSGQPATDRHNRHAYQAQARRRGDVRLDLMGIRALFVAVLQRGHPAQMQGHADIGRIRIEGLTKHEHCLFVRIPGWVVKAVSAVNETSPETFFQAKWNASVANHMLAPLPLIV